MVSKRDISDWDHYFLQAELDRVTTQPTVKFDLNLFDSFFITATYDNEPLHKMEMPLFLFRQTTSSTIKNETGMYVCDLGDC